MKTKETIVAEGKLNEVIIHTTKRQNGSIRIQQDFSFCPTMAEQHTAHLSDLNYLIAKYKPDELAAYIHARTQHRTEILGHDFSREPSLQDAKGIAYRLKKAFTELPEEVQQQFKNHVEFLKFIDNPANQEKMIKAGILTPKEVSKLTTAGTTPTKEKEAPKEPAKAPSES